MKKLLALALLIATALPTSAATRYADQQETAAQVERDFSTALDLWRDGRLEELYDHTTPSSMTRERFVKSLAKADRRPACCWEKLQDVKVSVESREKATVTARVGFDSPSGATEFASRSFRVTSDGSGAWKLQASDLVSLSKNEGGARKRASRKR